MKNLLIILASLFVWAIPSTALACSCGWSTPATAFNNAEAIFIGKVIVGSEQLAVTGEGGKPVTLEAGDVRFTVEEVFKGDATGETTVRIESHQGTSCGPYGLEREVSYVVYAYRDEKNKTVLYSGVCTRTKAVKSEYAAEDLEFLRNLPAAGTGGRLEGRIWYDSRVVSGGGAEPMPGLRVVIRAADDNREIIVTTDKKGEFAVDKLKAGSYTVAPLMPKNFYIEESTETVEVADLGTAAVGFEAYYTGNVSGRVVDKNGTPYNSVFLHFLSTDEGDNQKHVYGNARGENGEFEIEGVPPGSYVMFIELHHDDYNRNRKYYYPGTYNRAKASVVKVGLGGKVRGLKFTLPREYEVRTIEGQVVWQDGTPAADAELSLRCPKGLAANGLAIEMGAVSGETDKNGRFRLEVFAGETYWLDASAVKPGAGGEEIQKYSPASRITIRDNIKNRKIVLSQDFEAAACPDYEN